VVAVSNWQQNNGNATVLGATMCRDGIAVSLFMFPCRLSKKSYAARSMAYIRPIVISFLKANAMSDFL
jgi:hypothetical protein